MSKKKNASWSEKKKKSFFDFVAFFVTRTFVKGLSRPLTGRGRLFLENEKGVTQHQPLSGIQDDLFPHSFIVPTYDVRGGKGGRKDGGGKKTSEGNRGCRSWV